MNEWRRRVAFAIAAVLLIVVVYALGYRWAMITFEGRDVTMLQAVQVVVETITTAGFGGHSPWQSDPMNAFVVAMNLTGVALVFIALPVFVFPLLRQAVAADPPRSVDISGHVIVGPAGPRIAAVIEELEKLGHSYTLVEADLARAKELHGQGRRVVHGDMQILDTLERAGIARASALVIDAEDDVTTSIVLTAREANEGVRILTLVDDEALERYQRLAGATRVLSPRRLLGESLARHTPYLLAQAYSAGGKNGKEVELLELVVASSERVRGLTLDGAAVRERYGVEVIGAWIGGEFRTSGLSSLKLESRMRLLVGGTPARVARVREELGLPSRSVGKPHLLIIGYGRSGQAATRALDPTRVTLTVIDVRKAPGVHVVGDARDPEVYRAAAAERAAAIIIDLDDDTVAMFATLIVREQNPDAFIVTGANVEENVRKLYRAGADYVQSLASVTGRMVAASILEGEDVIALEGEFALVRAGAGGLVGRTVAEERVRTRTGVSILAAVQEGRTTSPVPPETRFCAGDEIFVAGTDAAVRRFEQAYGGNSDAGPNPL